MKIINSNSMIMKSADLVLVHMKKIIGRKEKWHKQKIEDDKCYRILNIEYHLINL
jgi:hypothetical protein